MKHQKIINNLTPKNEVLSKYFQDINSYKRITPEEEVELAVRIKEGDKKALDKMVTSNLRFVVSIAKGYQSSKMPLEDLIACGNLGLIKAAMRFDETRGFKFISYAVWWIKRSILEEIMKNGRTVRLPTNISLLLYKVKRQSSYLEQKNGTPPTIEDIASNLETSVEEINKIIPFVEREVSLDKPLSSNGEDSDETLADFLPSKEFQTNDYSLLIESRKSDLEQALNTLKKNEIGALQQSFGINSSTNYTKYYANQLTKKVLQKLRENKKIRTLLKEHL